MLNAETAITHADSLIYWRTLKYRAFVLEDIFHVCVWEMCQGTLLHFILVRQELACVTFLLLFVRLPGQRLQMDPS